jgi:site-specific recombinase XerD
MENKIYLQAMQCYARADDKTREKINKGTCFDLDLLPTEGLRKEFHAFIKKRDTSISLNMMISEKNLYIRLCRFMKEKHIQVESLQEKELETWLKQIRGWLLREGKALIRRGISDYGKEKITPSGILTYFRKVFVFTQPEDMRDETEKDIWDLSKIDVPYRKNPIKNVQTLNFSEIIQPEIREEIKKAIFFHLHYEALDSINKELTAMRRISKYLKEHYPDLDSCEDISREILEEYLTYLRTEDVGIKSYKGHLTRLRAILESVGKLYGYPYLESLFLNSDIPRLVQTEMRSYSDEELKRFNAALLNMDEQICRLMVVHQMLGTRISDTLTLQTDCLYEQNGHPMIRIRQMKTNTYVKPISAELTLLIEKSIEYTRQRHGDTLYIFVNEQNPAKAMQYNTVQVKIIRMIQKEQLRDDRGELFGFGTHMFRHCYGIKLTEMHLDDWTIAKLLGHSSTKNVKYYRKMSNQLLAEETRAVRERMSRKIMDNLDGWGEEYEQIRQYDSYQ